jgi:hypothetical protein
MLGYGVKLTKDDKGEDVWTYTFTMRREYGQASIREALCHPTTDELDDYRDYQRAKADKEIPEVKPKSHHQAKSPLSSFRDGVGRHDSEYRSGKSPKRLGSKEVIHGRE